MEADFPLPSTHKTNARDFHVGEHQYVYSGEGSVGREGGRGRGREREREKLLFL